MNQWVNGIQLINKEMRLKSKAAHPQQKSKGKATNKRGWPAEPSVCFGLLLCFGWVAGRGLDWFVGGLRAAQPHGNKPTKKTSPRHWFVSVVCSSFSLSCFVFAFMDWVKWKKWSKTKSEEKRANRAGPQAKRGKRANSSTLLFLAVRGKPKKRESWFAFLLPSIQLGLP